jgi:hypothetical protein
MTRCIWHGDELSCSWQRHCERLPTCAQPNQKLRACAVAQALCARAGTRMA